MNFSTSAIEDQNTKLIENEVNKQDECYISMPVDEADLFCKLCLNDEFTNDELMKIQSCDCMFCLECMKMYVSTLVNDRQHVISITCPDSNCSKLGVLSSNEIKELLESDEQFSKYQKLKFEQEVAVDPSRTFCPKISCSAVCKVPVDENMVKITYPLGAFSVSCNECQHRFCYFCHSEWQPLHECHHGLVENTNRNKDFNKLRMKFGLLNGPDRGDIIKRCPFCGIPIERNRGCAQMICKNCNHVFCWYCLKLLDNDFMLRHYDKGPCRNMLGHSRAQVLRHRLGIIGLFIAFYLLVIISSPILLLATPLFLCYKLKEFNRKRRSRQMYNNQPTIKSSTQITSTSHQTSSHEQHLPTGLVAIELNSTSANIDQILLTK